ncbi:TonB-dependent receptor [Hyphococcus luteus]|uniref:TonB-dependent receptor n=1 Tax=Hyphococcus luteus TaxID=2058213 RepID=A0A2S7KA44_9PROT|nr:TonB-dependent receptor [Marinicaulis flavus]PQA89348.1 TonB-dependent receptor [Marinicaulis flavus]
MENATSRLTFLGRRPVLKTALLASSMWTGIAGAAMAQSERDTIVVTAQKREQNIQDVPISIIALGTETLEELEISSFEDYAKYLPSVSFQSTSPNATSVYMRGVVSGGDGNHSASLPSVGVYLDEQPVTTILGFLPLHIYDIERVEALAGPQGTLFGASSQAGTLRIITNKPKIDEFEAGFDAEVNTIKDGEIGYQLEGMVNQPVSDNAAVRLVGWYVKDGGYIDNVLDSRTFPSSGITKTNADLVEDDFNDGETYGARIALKIDLDENWTVTPTLLGQKSNFNGRSTMDPKLGDLNAGRFYDEKNEDRFFQAALTVEGKIGDFDLTYAGAYLKRQIDSFSDYTDYAYYYDVLYGYGAYFYDDMSNLVDPSQTYQGDDSFAKYSNEIRISTPQDKRLRAVAGFFQNHQTHYIHQQYVVIDLASFLEVPDHEDTVWLTEQKRTDRDLALFTEISFDITDRLTFSGGVRGYRYKNSLTGFFGYGGYYPPLGVDLCFAPAVVPGAPCTNLDNTVKGTGETHKLNLTYDIDDDKMVYVTYSTGYRPGGANRRGNLPPYLEDKLVNYEVGFKTAWADNRLIFNAAFFRQNWKDFQFPILGQNGLTEIKNANQAIIKGFEADLSLRPIEGLTINGAVSVIDAKLSANYCGYVNQETGAPETGCPFPMDDPSTLNIDETAPPLAADGTRLPVVPDFKGTITARYEFPVGQYIAHLQGSASGQTDSAAGLTDADVATLGPQPGYAVFDFSVGVRDEDWELVAYIANAFDERARQFNFVACGVCGDRVQYSVNRPRTIGVRFGKDF